MTTTTTMRERSLPFENDHSNKAETHLDSAVATGKVCTNQILSNIMFCILGDDKIGRLIYKRETYGQ
jgi:hypothetical protein